MTAATQIAGVAGAVVLVAGTALALAAQHLGIFKKVKWTEGPMEELEFVYVEHKGSYKNIGNAFELLAKALTEKGVAVTQQSHTFVGTMPLHLRSTACSAQQDRCSASNGT